MVDEKSMGERLARIETRVDGIKEDVDGIRGTLWWVMVTLVGAIVLAFANFIIDGGLAPGP